MRQWIPAGLVALVASLAAAGPARADTYVVVGSGDAANPQPCTEIQPTYFQCDTLRAAVNEANAAANADTIGLPVGAVTLTAGALNLLNDVILSGGGPRSTSIVSDGEDRAIAVLNGADATLIGVEVRGGSVSPGAGGNILTAAGTTLTLSVVRVTAGTATQGAGIANGGDLIVHHSLIDRNTAQSAGGAILNAGTSDSAPSVTIFNSTLAHNAAELGGAIRSQGNLNNRIDLTHTTIGRNGGGGISFAAAHPATAKASIIASNPGGPACSGAQLSSGAFNVAGDASCGLTAGSNRQNADPGLAAALSDQGGHTDVLTIPAGSVAEDLVSPCELPIDQRSAPRFTAAGQACDAGAYERSPAAGGGGSSQQPPPEEPAPPTPAPAQPPAPTPSPAPEPVPVFQQTVVAKPVRGSVRVRVPGSDRFVELEAGAGIPLGSTVDTKQGAVEIAAVPRPGAQPDRATFSDGIFRVTQSRGVTDLRLTEPLAPCSKRARLAARKPRSRKLWGDGRGAFRTTGNYSAATVRGTRWLVQDSCAGTLTRVTQGTVRVRDKVRKRTITLRAGKRYLARPK